MRTRGGATLVAAALAAWACASASPPVPVSGEAAAIASLSGHWAGRYVSEATGRHGTIDFRLEAGRDTARGDVQMVPVGSDEPLHPFRPDGPAAAMSRPAPRFLSIRFVTVETGELRGSLEPYADPVSGHRLLTTFRGRVHADSITGSFSTVDDLTGARSAGSWWVVRRR